MSETSDVRRSACVVRSAGFWVLGSLVLFAACGGASSRDAGITAGAALSNASRPPEGAELETLIQSSPDFQQPLQYFVHRNGYVQPGELGVYRSLDRNGFIHIDAETPEYKTTVAGASMVVSITDRAKALPGFKDNGSNWGLPLAHQRVISATLKEQGQVNGAYFYDVVYDWQSDDVGGLIESDLPERMKPPQGQYQVGVSLQPTKTGWIVRQYAGRVRIDR